MKKALYILLVVIGIICIYIISKNLFVEDKSSAAISKNNETYSQKIEEKNDYKMELSKIYPQKEGFTWYYDGPLDTGKVVTVSDVIQEEEGKVLVNIKILEEDRVGEVPPEERIKNSYYVIEKDRIIENGRIVLQNPLIVGNAWTNKDILLFPGIKRKPNTEIQAITKITEIKDGVISTETIITEIEGFKNRTYKEISHYKEGLGLVNRVFDYQDVEDYTMFLRLKQSAEQPVNKEKWYLRK